MADDERMNYFEWKAKQASRRAEREFVERFGVKFGFKRPTQITREGAPSTADVVKELEPVLRLNNNLLGILKKIERRSWKGFERIIWGKEKSIVDYYTENYRSKAY